MRKICNGKHNISLCTSRNEIPTTHETLTNSPISGTTPRPESCDAERSYLTATPTKSKNNILMTTARSDAQNPQTMEKCSARILFDTGSQRTYITNEMKARLKFRTIKSERINLNTFGNKSNKICEVDLVQLKFVPSYTKKEAFVEAMCVPLICPDLLNQRTVEVARKFRVFGELCLADCCNNDKEGGGGGGGGGIF